MMGAAHLDVPTQIADPRSHRMLRYDLTSD